MERDFMGLTVKQEISDEPIDAAPISSSAMQWSFPNKSSSPQLFSFQEDKTQKNIVLDQKQGGVRYTMTTYPTTVHRSITNQTNMTNPVQAKRSGSPVVGTTDLRNTSKIPGAPAQLTIFYNGSVCVYDNISPEKAQAIMLLAGNGPVPNPIGPPPAAPVLANGPRPSVLDGFVVSRPYGTMPPRSSPIPVTVSIKDTSAAKPAGVVVSSSNTAEPKQLPNSISFLSSDTVPQFRRKSLARFLEKRKERVISAAPYGDKQSSDCNNPVIAIN